MHPAVWQFLPGFLWLFAGLSDYLAPPAALPGGSGRLLQAAAPAGGAQAAQCDAPGWADAGGHGCDWYEEDHGRCISEGLAHHAGQGANASATAVSTAATACCTCVHVLGHVSIYSNVLFSAVICAIGACAYRSMVTSKRQFQGETFPVSTGGDFSAGMLDCFTDKDTFCLACCCGCGRIADTYATTGVMSYFEAFGWWLGAVTMSQMMAGLFVGFDTSATDNKFMNAHMSIQSLLLALTFGRWRGLLRQKLAGSGSGASDIVLWFLASYLCCSLCPVIQEARSMDQAAGERPTCTCSLVKTDPAQYEMVGNPTAVQ